MANLTPTPTLAEIAAAQAASCIFAFDRNSAAQALARLQKLYARRRAQLDLLGGLFDEGTPELTLRGETQQLTLRGELVTDTYAVLRDALDQALLQLEKQIVEAHQQVAQWAADVAADHAGETDYVPHILALCAPDAPAAGGIVSRQAYETRHRSAAAQ